MPAAPASNQAAPLVLRLFPAVLLTALGVVVFHFYGNSTRGYLDTASLLVWWTRQWFNPASELQHAPLLVAVSAYLVWRKLTIQRSEVRSQKSETRGISSVIALPPSGFFLLTFAFLLHSLGYATQQPRISLLALLLFLWGCAAALGGPRWRTATAFPLALLVLAFPWSFLDEIGFWLRLAVVSFAEKSAHVFGHEVVRSGTQLLAPDGSYSYDVAAACSGVRSLTAMIALALVVGYLRLETWPRRLALLATTPLYILLGNFLRIAAIIAAGAFFGQRAGEVAHTISGYAIFVVVFALLYVTAAKLGKSAARPMPDASLPVSKTSSPQPAGLRLQPFSPSAFSLSLCVLLAAAHIGFAHHLANRPPASDTALQLAPNGRDPAELPFLVASRWIGQPIDVTAAEREILPPDTGFSRKLYFSTSATTGAREEVLLSLVLSGRDRSSIHRPELCLIGQGWTLAEKRTHRFDLPTGPLEVTLLTLEQQIAPASTAGSTPIAAQKRRALLAYFFTNSTTQVASHRGMLLRDALDRLRLRADRWAYVVALTPLEADSAGAFERIHEILSAIWPQICNTSGPASSASALNKPKS